MGADMTQPMAIVTIGGLIYGTFLTLFVVPCIYDILNRRKYVTISDSELDAADEELDIMSEVHLISGGGEQTGGGEVKNEEREDKVDAEGSSDL